MNLPKVTMQQRNIVDLIYQYRFLNRIQIQAFLKHKDYKTINMWLRDLREKQYVVWIYSTDFAERTKPAIYYLGLNGIRRAKDQDLYEIEDIRKRYRDSNRSQTFIDRCLLLGDCAITLEQTETKHQDVVINYIYEVEANYSVGYFEFLSNSELIQPQLCYQRLIHEDYDEPYPAESYLLEVFDPTLPRYRIKKRLANYIQYLDEESEVWKSETDTDSLPIIQFVCSKTSDLIYAKRRTRGLLANSWENSDPEATYTVYDYGEVEKRQYSDKRYMGGGISNRA